jgi:hypothetical protein
MKSLFVAGPLALSVALIPSVNNQSANRAGEILASARRALGGAKLASVGAVGIEGAFRRQMGMAQIEGTTELLIVRPDRMRRVENIAFAGVRGPSGGPTMERTTVVSGEEAWEQFKPPLGMAQGGIGMPTQGARDRMPSPPATDPDADPERARVARLRGELDRWSLVFFLASDGAFVLSGLARTTAGDADVLTTTDAAGEPVQLCIDRQTQLPVELTFREVRPSFEDGSGLGPFVAFSPGQPPGPRDAHREASGGPRIVSVSLFLSQYREEAGVTWPHHIDQSVEDVPFEQWTIKKIRLNPNIKSDTFRKR